MVWLSSMFSGVIFTLEIITLRSVLLGYFFLNLTGFSERVTGAEKFSAVAIPAGSVFQRRVP